MVPKIAILAMVLSGIAFAHVNVRGAILVEGERCEDGELPGFYDEWAYKLRNGWPVPFGNTRSRTAPTNSRSRGLWATSA